MNKYSTENNPVLQHTFEFSLAIIKYCDELNLQKKYAHANQLFRSGTSIGANAHEAQHAESRADFIHKFKVAAKEMNETRYWLLLCKHSESYPESKHLLDKLEEIQKIINSIIATAKRKHPFTYLLTFLF